MTASDTPSRGAGASDTALAPSGSWSRKLCDFAHARRMLPTMAVLSFFEAIILPVPLEAVAIPVMAANRRRLWTIAWVITIGCLLGALVGYAIGATLFDSLGRWLVDAMGWGSALEDFQAQFREHGFWTIVVISVSPIPFQIALIGAGMAQYSLPMFLLAVGLSRSLRYLGMAGLVALFGDRAERLVVKHTKPVALVTLLLALAILASQFWPSAST